MADIDSVTLFPVYLPRALQDGEDKNDYDLTIGQNENYLNQNFNNLYNSLSELAVSLETLRQKAGL